MSYQVDLHGPGPCDVCGGRQGRPARPCRCREVLREFTALMLARLRANAEGGRSGWCGDEPEEPLNRLHHVLSKLHVVYRELECRWTDAAPQPTPWGEDVEALLPQFAADTANAAMMLLDSLGWLVPALPDGLDASPRPPLRSV